MTKTGTLLFATSAPIVNLAYESGSHSGTTDAKGTFTYEAGSPVRFLAGELLLGTAAGADVLSPYQMVASAKCDDDALKKLVGVLEALDTDADATNGITVPASAKPSWQDGEGARSGVPERDRRARAEGPVARERAPHLHHGVRQ